MKKISLLVVGIILLSHFTAMSQRGNKNNRNSEEYKSEKIAYITSTLDLTPDEATKFWPIYNEMEAKKKEHILEVSDHRKEIAKNFDSLTEKEAKEALEFHHEHMRNMNSLVIEYQQKLSETIPAKKVLLLLKAEKDFRRNMLKKLGKRGNKSRPGNSRN